MTKKCSFKKAFNKIKKRYPYLTLIEYNGSNNNAIFIDDEYGKFTGKFKNVYKGDKSHPQRGLKNRLKKREKTYIKNYGVDNPSKSKIIRDKYKQTNLNKYGVEYPTQNKEIYDKVKQTNLEKYGVEHNHQRKEIREKVKQTCLKKYGVDHFSKTNEFKKTREQNNLDKYGVKCTLQTQENKIKSKTTCLNKYGKEFFSQTKQFKINREKTCLKKYKQVHEAKTKQFKIKVKKTNIKNNFWKNIDGYTVPEFYKLKKYDFSITTFYNAINNIGINNAINYNNHKSNIENIISLFLDKHNIKYTFNKKLHKDYIEKPDFLIQNNNLIIECDGIYYHSDKIKNNKNWHKERQEKYKKLGYSSLFFREDEILEKTEIVESIILAKLGLITNRVYARKCEVKEIDLKTSSTFFEKNHLMGKGKGKTFALIYNNQIVSAIRIINKKDYIDINRFCNSLHTSVAGGLSKLLKHIIKLYHPQKIISFVDMRYGDGSSLKKLGFQEKTNYVSFKWTDFKNTYHRLNFKNNSGYEKGLYKIWDCGQKKFEIK